MTTQFQNDDFDRNQALSQTAWALQELQLYGTRAFQDEVDLRPMPEPERLIDAVTDIFDAIAATLGDTRMEPDLEELLWGQVNLFHRAAARVERLLDEAGFEPGPCHPTAAGFVASPPAATLVRILGV